MMKLNKEDVVNKLFELIYSSMDLENKIRKYGTDVEISSSEIHLVKCIYELPNSNVTSLAKFMEMSKSAVSQTLNKLKKKGLVIIDIDPDNRSRYLLNLSEKGIRANRIHLEYKADIFQSIYSILDEFDLGDINQIGDFLSKANVEIIKRFEE